MSAQSPCSRRQFLARSSSCALHLSMMALPFPLSTRTRWESRRRGQIVAEEPWGRLEEVGDGLWALISTPLTGDYTTLCNGGIITGDAGVLVAESFARPEGARWLAQHARALTGRWPTHVVVTHYHGDHSGGLTGFSGEAPEFTAWATLPTRDLVLGGAQDPDRTEHARVWADVKILSVDEPSTIDLGGRSVRVVPRSGHTASDATIELDEAGMVWCGDLVWNGMFPNYMDATPSVLSSAVRDLQRGAWTTYVPGHGPLAGPSELGGYMAVLDDIEAAARNAVERGWSAGEAGSLYRIPPELGDWTLFNPRYFERAIEAWMRELTQESRAAAP